MSAATLPFLGAGGLALSAMAKAIQALYGVASDLNEYLDQHIKDMKGSDNPTIARTGRILEMAKLGFGLGYITPVIIISVGQLLLGNTLAAITTVATAATLTNPIAMTCAAIGAIYYGWSALSDVEREEMLNKLSKGLDVGIELIKSVVRFVVEKTKELLSSKNIEEIKKFIESAAAVFGKTLSDVTHKIGDVVGDTFNIFKKKSASAMEATLATAMRRIGIIRMKVAMQASPRCLAGGGHQVGEQALVEQADHAYTISTFSGCSQPFKASSKASSRRTRTASPSTISHSATALR